LGAGRAGVSEIERVEHGSSGEKRTHCPSALNEAAQMNPAAHVPAISSLFM
jgi:hypothetical protein